LEPAVAVKSVAGPKKTDANWSVDRWRLGHN
jgi:hypothetical protein